MRPWLSKLLFSLNGRKLIVVVIATGLIIGGVIGEETWRWIATAAVTAVGLEKFAGLWNGRGRKPTEGEGAAP